MEQRKKGQPSSRDFAWAEILASTVRDMGNKELTDEEREVFVYETAQALSSLSGRPVQQRREFVESVVSGVKQIPQDLEINDHFASRYRFLLGQALNIPSKDFKLRTI